MSLTQLLGKAMGVLLGVLIHLNQLLVGTDGQLIAIVQNGPVISITFLLKNPPRAPHHLERKPMTLL